MFVCHEIIICQLRDNDNDVVSQNVNTNQPQGCIYRIEFRVRVCG